MKTIYPSLTGLLAIAFLSLAVLSACSADAAAREAVLQTSVPDVSSDDAAPVPQKSVPDPAESGWVMDVPRIDEQGAVTVEITPLDLEAPGETLDFSVVLNTHSVDLSMDLAAMATLATDTGLELQAVTWDAPRGGHHVQGVLQFPASLDGPGVMNGVKRLTLMIRGLDAPERTFVWER